MNETEVFLPDSGTCPRNLENRKILLKLETLAVEMIETVQTISPHKEIVSETIHLACVHTLYTILDARGLLDGVQKQAVLATNPELWPDKTYEIHIPTK